MKKLILLLAAVLVLGTASVASAEDGRVSQEQAVKAVGSTLETHITNGGKALVRGAKVTAVTSSTITAVQSWGTSTMTWLVSTDASTHFIRRYDGNSALSEIQIGDFISFQGMLDQTQPQLTVKASIVKDWSNQRKNATISGTVVSTNATSSSFVLSTKDRGDVTVEVASATKLMRGNATTTFAGLMVGDKVNQASGLYNNLSKVLSADTVKIAAVQPVVAEKVTFEGKLKDFVMCATIVGQNCPSFMFSYNHQDYTVFLASNAMVLTNNWTRTQIGSMKVGDTVRIYGSIRTNATTTIDALIVRDTNLK